MSFIISIWSKVYFVISVVIFPQLLMLIKDESNYYQNNCFLDICNDKRVKYCRVPQKTINFCNGGILLNVGTMSKILRYLIKHRFDIISTFVSTFRRTQPIFKTTQRYSQTYSQTHFFDDSNFIGGYRVIPHLACLLLQML